MTMEPSLLRCYTSKQLTRCVLPEMIRDTSFVMAAAEHTCTTRTNDDKIRSIHNLPTVSAHNSLLNIAKAVGDDVGDNVILERQEPPAFTDISDGLHSIGFEATDLTSSGFTTEVNDKAEGDFDSASHSIESFFGRIDNLEELYKLLCVRYAEAIETTDETGICRNRKHVIQPDYVRKVLLVGNPLPQLSGLNRFFRLTEVWITDCNISEILKSDFEGLNLRKLFIYNNQVQKVESGAMCFESLRVLWINGNQLNSLEFLADGLPVLEELNAAQNLISRLHVKDFLKCPLLRTLNVSGNPLNTLHDISALRSAPALHTLSFADPVYGKCPVSSYCDSRAMLLGCLGSQISFLDGKEISLEEMTHVNNYVRSRGLYYYSNSVEMLASQSIFRKTSLTFTMTKLSSLGSRLEILLDLNSRYKRIISNVQVIPIFTNAKNLMREQVEKIEQRIGKVIEWAGVSLRRLRTLMVMSRWEQEAANWMKYIEFQSHGNTQCHILHSIHGPLVGNANELCITIHELIAALSCPGLLPLSMIPKVETIIVIKDSGMEQALQATFEKLYAPNLEPKFIQPEYDPSTPIQISPPGTSGGFPTINYPNPAKVVTTYMDPDFQPALPRHAYPDSVVGLPDKAQPVYLFMICPPNAAANPLAYFQKVVNDKAIHVKSIKLTNCLWYALRKNIVTFGIVIVIKVLKEALVFVKSCRSRKVTEDGGPQHCPDCGCFSVKEPQVLAPAYIITISFTPEIYKTEWKIGTVTHDGDIVAPAKIALTTLTEKIMRHGHLNPIRPGQNKKSQFIRKGAEGGFICDLASTVPYLTTDGDIDRRAQILEIEPGHPTIQSLATFFGAEVVLRLTAVDLSGNKLRNIVALDGLMNLKKLNFSHNQLVDISPLNKLPNLIELKLGWNNIRSLATTGEKLQVSTPHLLTLEILPNPFQDIREFTHIAVILKRLLPALNRVDDWIGSWNRSPEIPKLTAKEMGITFDQVALKESWGSYQDYRDLSGKSLTDLNLMTLLPPLPERTGTDGLALDLSDNYLTSEALQDGPFVKTLEWRTVIVKLELQENELQNLNWMKNRSFPNIQILNLANNSLTEVYFIPLACPALRHLVLCGNPIPFEGFVLEPLKMLAKLTTLSCSGAPITNNPEYSQFVVKYLTSVKILDGIPMVKWKLLSEVESTGGVVTQDWLEEKLALKNFSSLKHLSFPNCNLQQFGFCGSYLPNLMTVDLSRNRLTSLTSLSSLPRLKVLQMSHNRVSSLGGSTCPLCFSNTVQSQFALASKQSTQLGLPTARKPKPIFPKLEVLILSHNDLSSVNDLHIHAMPNLQTLLCNCNKMTSLNGLEGGTIRAIVLDRNRIREVPYNCLVGCKSLRYLHLEHNRLTGLPRATCVANLTALHVSYNKIHSLNDMSSLARLTDLSLTGNPVSRHPNYRFRIGACLPILYSLDGEPLAGDRLRGPAFNGGSHAELGKFNLNQNQTLLPPYCAGLISNRTLKKRSKAKMKKVTKKKKIRSRCPGIKTR